MSLKIAVAVSHCLVFFPKAILGTVARQPPGPSLPLLPRTVVSQVGLPLHHTQRETGTQT